MKTFFTALFVVCLIFFAQAQEQENPIRLKQINVVITKFRNLKSGESINKTYEFSEGKLRTIQTSDVTQSFFYNPNGILDRTVKEKMGSNWKEVVTYSYDSQNRLTKFKKNYLEGNETITKTVSYTYQGARVRAITKRSVTKEAVVEDNEFIIDKGVISRRALRDRNQQIITKNEYNYLSGNMYKDQGLFGDKTIKYFTYDDKNSADYLMVQNIFGENFMTIVPLVSFHDEEFNFQMISQGNELTYKSTQAIQVVRSGSFKYNANNYPESYSLSEEEGMVKTVKNYIYE